MYIGNKRSQKYISKTKHVSHEKVSSKNTWRSFMRFIRVWPYVLYIIYNLSEMMQLRGFVLSLTQQIKVNLGAINFEFNFILVWNPFHFLRKLPINVYLQQGIMEHSCPSPTHTGWSSVYQTYRYKYRYRVANI